MPRWLNNNTLFINIFIHKKPFIQISELQAFDYLKNQSLEDENIMVINSKTFDNVTPVASIFLSHNTFFSGRVILDRHDVNYQLREKESNLILNSTNQTTVDALIKKNKIKYIFAYKNDTQYKLLESNKNKQIFENASNIIYKL